MRRLLVINPNTSSAVTALLQLHAQKTAGEGTCVDTRTARFGAPYISSEASYAVAGHAVLDAWADAQAAESAAQSGTPGGPYSAILIACFGDPGLLALRECSTVPVTGLAEASFVQAARSGRFAIVTGGARWKPMLERLAHTLGFNEQLAGIQTVEQSGAELARDPTAAHAILAAACNEAASRFGAQVVILGGAGLAGMARAIAPLVTVPLIDSVDAGVRYALSGPPVRADARGQFDFAWNALSPVPTPSGDPQ